MIEALLAAALKAGMGVLEFWDLTPRETFQAIEAAAWRMEQAQRGRAWLAWHVAALVRSKKLPPLARLFGLPEAKPLSGDELENRRREFAQMKASYDRTVGRSGDPDPGGAGQAG